MSEPNRPAVVLRDAKPETPKDTGTWLDNVCDDQRHTAVQNLLQTARGVSLILWSLVEKQNEALDWSDIAGGLSTALRVAADQVDAVYFARAGELAETLEPEILAALLKDKLARMAKE
jgi:hypothetical protein